MNPDDMQPRLVFSDEQVNILNALRCSNVPRSICFGFLGSISGCCNQRTTPGRVSPHNHRPWTSAFRFGSSSPQKLNRRLRVAPSLQLPQTPRTFGFQVFSLLFLAFQKFRPRCLSHISSRTMPKAMFRLPSAFLLLHDPLSARELRRHSTLYVTMLLDSDQILHSYLHVR